MHRITILAVLTWQITVFAADSGKGGFIPLTPDGYPLSVTNAAAPAVAPPNLAAVVESSTATNAAALGGVVLDDRHKLAPGDKLSFQILEDRHLPNLDDSRLPNTAAEQSKALIVADTGELDVPYVGRINVSGRTCKEVAADLKVLLEKDYYYRATVVLGLDQISRVPGHVYVWGEVRNQGAVEIPLNENLTAGKAIVRAGMFTDWAKKTKVKVIRSSKVPGETKQEIIVNMEEVLEQGKTDKDVPVDADDSIIVPRSKINF